MLSKILSITLIFSLAVGTAQTDLNMDLVSEFKRDTNEDYNDVWGYVDGAGIEYAILGTRAGTSVISLANPSIPEEVAYIAGVSSTWRDMKSNGAYIYVTTGSGNDGLLIVDMSDAPNNITWQYWRGELDIGAAPDTLNACHNIYIDNGYAYLSGCNISSRGVIILDLSEPFNPVLAGAEDTRYSHDAYVQDDILVSSDIFDGFFSIWDIADKANPIELAQQATSFAFTHNTWMSDDGRYLFSTDERGNAYLDSWDISDFNNIQFLDRYRPLATENQGVIPHNTHYHDGYLVTSWYTEGVQVLDASHPDNLVLVGSYRSHEGAPGGGAGVWGAYPFLPSGLVLISNRQKGLAVLAPNYQRAALLEGNIRNASDLAALNGVEISVESNELNQAFSDIDGVYKTGLATAGIFDVTADLKTYIPLTKQVTLVNGEVQIVDFELERLPVHNIAGVVKDSETGEVVPNATITVYNEDFAYDDISNANGAFGWLDVYEGEYDILITLWGYEELLTTGASIDQTANLEFELIPGYKDDFIADMGWTSVQDMNFETFVRAEPVLLVFGTDTLNPSMDVAGDLGKACYLLGNGTDILDNISMPGQAVLSSPLFDLTTYAHPELNYFLWYVNFSASLLDADNVVEIYLTNGMDTILLEERGPMDSMSDWVMSSHDNLDQLIDITTTMQIHVVGANTGNADYMQVGLDGFQIVEGLVDGVNESKLESVEVKISPNPSRNQFVLELLNIATHESVNISIRDNLGRIVDTWEKEETPTSVSFGKNYVAGMYIVTIYNEGHILAVRKIVKG